MPELITHDTQILKSESHDAGIRIKIFGQHWNRNQNRLLLELDLESESWILENPGIGIGISPSGIGNGIGIRNHLQLCFQYNLGRVFYILSECIKQCNGDRCVHT